MRERGGDQNERYRAWYDAPALSNEAVVRLASDARRRIEKRLAQADGDKAAVAYSGGKDGNALWVLLSEMGLALPGVLALTRVELPSFEAWLAKNLPPSVSVYRTPHDLAWLAAHPEMLFPTEGRLIQKWASVKQRREQARFCRERGVRLLLTGRRAADGNFIRRTEDGSWPREGYAVFDPLRDWSQPELLAFLRRRDVPLPPSYFREAGWVNGSKHWALLRARQMGEGEWAYLWRHEPEVVRDAARLLPSARAFLEDLGERAAAQDATGVPVG